MLYEKILGEKVPGPPFFESPPLFGLAPPFKQNFPAPVPSVHPNFGQPPPLWDLPIFLVMPVFFVQEVYAAY